MGHYLHHTINVRLFACALGFLIGLSTACASIQVFQFTFENDGDLVVLPPFGTLTVSDNVIDKLKFTINVDEIKLGLNSDIRAFGFNLNFGGAVSLVGGGDALSLTPNDSIQGRNSTFDFVASFGNGNPTIEPAMFEIMGTGLDLNALDNAGISTQNNKPDAQFAVHVQSTSAATTGGSVPGSESLGGLYIPVLDPGGDPDVPEPTSIFVWSLLAYLGTSVSRRR